MRQIRSETAQQILANILDFLKMECFLFKANEILGANKSVLSQRLEKFLVFKASSHR